MAAQPPRVSIGMPVYNGERYLREALDSLLAQSFMDFELIISDNGSTDGTEIICREYAARDPRIRYYRQDRNRGGAWNRNQVFLLGEGEYFKWQDYDDLCAPQLLEQCVAVLDREPAVVWCYANATIIDEHGQEIRRYVENLHLRSASPSRRYRRYHQHDRDCPLCSVYFGLGRRSVLEQTPLVGAYVNSEANLMSELALRGEWHEIPEHLFYRRDHPGISTRAYATAAERIIWFDPEKRGSGGNPGWRMIVEQLRSVTRVTMNRPEKVRCYLAAGRYFLWLADGSMRAIIGTTRRYLLGKFGASSAS